MTWSSWAPIAAQGTSSAISTGFNFAVSAESNKRSREWNEKMSQLEFDRNKEMWNAQNKYNSPAAQMQRFREAGLNPRLIYGRGNEGNAAEYPRYHAPMGKFGLPEKKDYDFLSAYNDTRMKDAQIDLVLKQKENIVAQTKINNAKAKLIEGMAGIIKDTVNNKLNEYAYKNAGYNYDLQAKEQNVNRIKEDIARIIQQTNLSVAQQAKIAKWFEGMSKGINYDRDPWYVRQVADEVWRIWRNLGLPEPD